MVALYTSVQKMVQLKPTFLKKIVFIIMVELDNWRSAAKALVNKMGLNT